MNYAVGFVLSLLVELEDWRRLLHFLWCWVVLFKSKRYQGSRYQGCVDIKSEHNKEDISSKTHFGCLCFFSHVYEWYVKNKLKTYTKKKKKILLPWTFTKYRGSVYKPNEELWQTSWHKVVNSNSSINMITGETWYMYSTSVSTPYSSSSLYPRYNNYRFTTSWTKKS